MNTTRSIVLAVLVVLCPAGLGRAADGDKPANPNPKPAPVQVYTAGGGLNPGAWGRFGVNGASAKNLWSIMASIGELNLTPDFTLTPEQKEKIQAIREDVKEKQEKWRADHAEDFKHLQELGTGLAVRNGQLDPDKLKEYQAAQTAVQETAPKEDEAVDQIRGLLTTDQLRRLDALDTRRRAESERMMKEMQIRATVLGERANPAPKAPAAK